MSYDKQHVNAMLRALLGSDELVTRWWKSANWRFKLDTPENVWERDPAEVFDYVYQHSFNYGGS